MSKLEINASRSSIRVTAEGAVALLLGAAMVVLLVVGSALYFAG